MPLILSEKLPDFGHFYLWSMTEDHDFFRQSLSECHLEMSHIEDWHPQRQLEWMAGRYLISEFLEKDLRKLIIHKEGKVSIADSDIHLSISHSNDLVGLQFNVTSIGLDIQIKTDQIKRVAHKFCSPIDYEVLGAHYTEQESRLINWSMKEAVFKAYGLGNVNYKDDITFTAFANEDKKKPLLQFQNKTGVTIHYQGRLQWIGDYCISQVVERATLNQ